MPVQGALLAPPGQLGELRGLVSSAGTHDLHVHAYLRPLLIEIASQRLAGRGQTLARMSAASGQELFGDRLWDIVRPNRPFPEDRGAPGVPPEELSAMLRRLEEL